MDRHEFSISVVIPTYNRIELLLKSLQHLERQTFQGFEVVIVDDGSTDNTALLVENYRTGSPLAIRFLRQQNRGPASARNHAISLIDSKLCLMIGDDIFASPTLVAKHMELHRRLPANSVAAVGLTRWSEADQEITPFMQWLDNGGLQFNYQPLLHGERPDWRYFYTSNLSVKTEILKNIPFDESYPHAAMEDMDLACRIEAKTGLELIFLPSAVAYHVHPTSFKQACGRMLKVGQSMNRFDQIWPGKRLDTSTPLKRMMQDFLLANSWALSGAVRLAERSLQWRCPNPFMRYVLGCYFRKGYNAYADIQHSRQGH